MKDISAWLITALLVATTAFAPAQDTPERAAQIAATPSAENPPQQVYIIPIEGMIEPALLYVIRRGVAEAVANNAELIIFNMDTPGGTLDAAGEILRIIQDVEVPTCTFVAKDAYSAGAIIALATDDIYMAPGSVIGDAMPIMMSPFSGAQEMPEDIQEKMVSGVSAKIRAAAEHGGHNTQLAEAMVRRENEFKIGDTVICPEGELLTLTNIEAAQEYGDPPQPLLSAGTVDSIDALLALRGLESARRTTLEVTAAERIARFIAALSSIFLILGLLGVYIEIKTPGFGLPGILGGACLLIFFWGHHIAGLAGMEDMIIFLLGVTLLLIEVFVIPGFGIVGATGIALICWSVIGAMVEHYPGTPWYQPNIEGISEAVVTFSISLVGTFALAWLLGRFLPRTGMFKRLILSGALVGTNARPAPAASAESLVGTTGRTLSPLRPAGSARFGDRRLDVVTHGDFIDANTAIRVVEQRGNRIIVTTANQEN
jgi:membrane-bound serine protease (ClpP class)